MNDDTLLIEHAAILVTMDAARREIADGAVLIRNNLIEAVGSSAQLRQWMAADPASRRPRKTIAAHGCVVLPGLINCHHTCTRR